MPVVLRSAIAHVVIHAGDELWGGGGDGVLIHTDQGKGYVADGFMEEVLVHEAAHSALDIAHKDSPGWRAAQAADGVFISDYARDHPAREDIAESFLPYLAVRYRPERLTDAERAAILTAIPNRLIYFDEQRLDMSPYVATESIAPVLTVSPFEPEPRIWRPFEGPPREATHRTLRRGAVAVPGSASPQIAIPLGGDPRIPSGSTVHGSVQVYEGPSTSDSKRWN